MSTIILGVAILSFRVTNTLNSLYVLNIVVPSTSSHPHILSLRVVSQLLRSQAR